MTIKTVNVHGGHNKIVTGASSYLNEVAEDRKVKNYLIEYLRDAGLVVYDCTDEVGDEKYENLANIVKKCNKHKVDIDISIHLNAHKKTSKPMGVETWNFSTKTKEISDRINKNISKALGIPNRGTKYSKDLYVLRNTNSKAILIECAFVDSKYDADKWDAKLVAKAIAEAVIDGDIKDKVKPPKKPSVSKPSTSSKIQVGDKVKYSGYLYKDSEGNGKSSKISGTYIVTLVNSNPYGIHLKGLGWVKKSDCVKVSASKPSKPKVSYYKKCSSKEDSIVDGLNSINVSSSFNNRKAIAKKNGILDYKGTTSQNNKLLTLLKNGKLKRV